MLTGYALAEHRIGNIRKKLGLVNLKLIENFRREIEKTFRNEIKNQNCRKLLLSDEHLQARLRSVEEIQCLKKFLDKFVNKYKIVVYLRSQPEMAISFYSDYCRSGGTQKTILQEVTEGDLLFNYEKLLKRWSKIFGFENIIPRIFSHTEFPDGDIKKDFIRLLGLNWNEFENVENSNESINVDAQRFLLEINKFLPGVIGDKNKARGNIVQLVSANRRGKGLLPTRKQVENFLKIFADSNERLRKKWFPERKNLFEVDFSIYPEKPFSDTDYTFAFKIFAEIWSKKHEEVLSLIEKNKAIGIPLKTSDKIEKAKTKLRKFITKK